MNSLSKLRVALLVTTFCAGCTPDGKLESGVGAEALGHEGLQARADADAGALLRDAVLIVEGRVAGQVAAVHHDDKTGEVSLTFVGGASDVLLARLASETSDEKLEPVDLVLTGLDDEGEAAEITIVRARGKEVSFDELTASDGKALFRCTMTFAAENVKHAYDTGALAEPSQAGAWSSELDVPGLDPEVFDGFTVRARRGADPVDGGASWVVETLTISVGADDHDAASALVAAGELVPLTILLTDGATGRRTKITTRGKPVKVTRKPLQSTIDWAVEGQIIEIAQNG